MPEPAVRHSLGGAQLSVAMGDGCQQDVDSITCFGAVLCSLQHSHCWRGGGAVRTLWDPLLCQLEAGMGDSQGQQCMSDQLLVLLWAQVPALQYLKLLGLSCRLPCKQQQAPALSDLPASSSCWWPARCKCHVAVG